MTSGDLLILAWRGLTRRPVRTLLTTLGLSVAVAGMVVFLSLGEGIRQVFTGQFRSVGPDVQLTLDGAQSGLLPPPNLPESVVARVRAAATPLGATQVTPVVTLLKQALDPTQSAVYYGLPAAQGIGALFEGLQAAQGRVLAAADEGQPVAVLGQSAARNAGARVGGTVDVLGTAVRVVGILEGGHGLNDTFTFLPLRTLQRLSGAPGQVSLVAVTLRNPGRAAPVAATLAHTLKLEGQTRGDVLAVINRALRVTDAARIGISVVALIVGGLAVANTVAMGVFERVREFGTLRAIGARPAFVRALVLTESALLSLAAGAAGLLVGVAGNAGVNAYTQDLAGIDAASLTPALALVALGVSLGLGLLAALIPARSAARLPVVEALSRL
ncbi:FtsX-like permease family protein [Deinococcus sp. KSM4-11]|uniref:ABC transporter permease n=1 Tax=Deinococcus sp. KSM4-11 TaxID=2568654 RepID=UPI0010A4235D|nr:ABC transporter permease [Deinococcus sp. KSM4-11]THF87058.1 FtsX-like permease family protein [Deinococcus sp. KSM4-11]